MLNPYSETVFGGRVSDRDLPRDLVASYQAQLNMYERALAGVGIQNVSSAIQPVRAAGE